MNNVYDSTIQQDDLMQPVLLEQIAKGLTVLWAYKRMGKGLLKY